MHIRRDEVFELIVNIHIKYYFLELIYFSHYFSIMICAYYDRSTNRTSRYRIRSYRYQLTSAYDLRIYYSDPLSNHDELVIMSSQSAYHHLICCKSSSLLASKNNLHQLCCESSHQLASVISKICCQSNRQLVSIIMINSLSSVALARQPAYHQR